ncbi:tellurite resistance protein [Pseudomonas floridensis]|uniref:Tellurite resistance protein n=1 Tax=Pseudomonas floridensis TaxID=1958950 RepID=A0A1X0N873_9PSED|nr:tellurite resistance protein [Pseudomonas floridensis]MEE4126553.1 hypothetical protein [Pseudomonas viridiflava]MEE4911984.1 hypothetical protein [Pseudomonas alliivorans]ORC60100.1 tellurite resistance protein [Pseudomonas floridensis]
MTDQVQLFRLRVDGNVAEINVPANELADRLSKYGVQRKDTLDRLLAGQTQRVLGQNLELLEVLRSGEQAEPLPVEPERATSTKAEAQPKPPKRVQSQSKPAPPTPFDGALQELTSRAKKLRKGTLIYGGTALGLAILGGVFYALGLAAEPSTAIDQILVPGAIAKAFQTADHAGGGIGGLMGGESVVGSILNSTALKMLSAVAMIAGVGAAIFTQRVSHIIPAMMIGTMPYAIGMFIEVGDSATTSKPNEFFAAVESKKMSTLQRLLSSREDLDEMARAYVLAQASIVDGSSSQWVVLTAKNLREGKINDSFAVPASVAYAIEATALGPESPSLSDRAKQHRLSALADASEWKRNSFWTLLLAGFLCAIATGHESIAQVIFRRVRRIGQLLTPAR